jgi:hypothetical protein
VKEEYCSCADCTAWRLRQSKQAVEVVVAAIGPPGQDHADDLQDALQALVDVVDRIGGYMTPEDQRVLWRARMLSRGGR